MDTQKGRETERVYRERERNRGRERERDKEMAHVSTAQYLYVLFPVLTH